MLASEYFNQVRGGGLVISYGQRVCTGIESPFILVNLICNETHQQWFDRLFNEWIPPVYTLLDGSKDAGLSSEDLPTDCQLTS